MPASSATYISATTRGRVSAGARSVASARPAVCVTCRPGADHQERERGRGVADPRGTAVVARHQDQRERHDRESAELDHRPHPDVRHALPAEHRAMGVGPEADQRAERREDERHADHQRDEPRRHAELDDHHAVERADQQHGRHADRDLEQRQPQQARQRQRVARRVGERQELGAELGPEPRDAADAIDVAGTDALLIGGPVPSPATCRSRSRCGSCDRPATTRAPARRRCDRAASLRRPAR